MGCVKGLQFLSDILTFSFLTLQLHFTTVSISPSRICHPCHVWISSAHVFASLYCSINIWSFFWLPFSDISYFCFYSHYNFEMFLCFLCGVILSPFFNFCYCFSSCGNPDFSAVRAFVFEIHFCGWWDDSLGYPGRCAGLGQWALSSASLNTCYTSRITSTLLVIIFHKT